MSTRQRRRRDNRRREHADTSPTRRRLLAAGGLTAGATLAMSGVAHATTFTVSSPADTFGFSDCDVPTNTDCTLRQAMDDANDNPGVDTIVFASSLSGQTITLGGTQLPTLTEGVGIQGPGASQLTVDGAGNSRVLGTNTTDAIGIAGLTITNGDSGAYTGGAIDNEDADLTLTDVTVSDSYNTNTGGGVYSRFGSLTLDASTVSGNEAYAGAGISAVSSPVTVTDSTVTGNTADGTGFPDYGSAYGGGIRVYGGSLTLDRSAVDHNYGQDGGGIYAVNGTGSDVTIRNSTIADNHVHDDAGGVYDNGSGNTLTVIGSTVTGNTAGTDGGGLKAVSLNTSPVLENSVVSGNTASSSDAGTEDLEASYPYTFDTAFSLVGIANGYVNATVPGSNILGVDPQLGALQDNGGPTETMSPASTSPVVNKGKAFGLTTDQRGLNRPVLFPGVPISGAASADGADMGAVELQAPPNPPPSGPTGQRSAALNKCKKKYKKAIRAKRKHDALTPTVKKHLKKKLRKCKRRANQLPV